MPNPILSDTRCDVKYIKRGHLKFDIEANFSETIIEAYNVLSQIQLDHFSKIWRGFVG